MTSGSGNLHGHSKLGNRQLQYLAASASQTTTGERLVSSLTWATPAAITFGTTLTSTQLNAKARFLAARRLQEPLFIRLQAAMYQPQVTIPCR